MKTAVVLDRINRKNLGARTTCKALFDILNVVKIEVIASFDIDFASEVDRNQSFEKIAEDISKLKKDETINVLHAMEKADCCIVNGEGSMIFSTPQRRELSLHYAMCMLAKIRGCKTYYINSIASPSSTSEIDFAKLDETKRFLSYVDEFVVRDEISYQFALNNITENVKYIPEILFDLAHRYSKLAGIKIPYGDMFLPYPESSFELGTLNALEKPYIAISGSSILNSKVGRTVTAQYKKLIDLLESKNYNVVIVKTDGSESYLNINGGGGYI